MTVPFEKVLDECIDRIILGGETVEACLARYPEYASELAALLRTVTATAQAYRGPVTAEAKEQSRHRLQAEMARLARQEVKVPERGTPRTQRAVDWQPRWAVALVATLLAVLIGGASTVAASGSALPGAPLYPVKRTTEEVRLALEFSKVEKAKLHVAYAERRATEISALLASGTGPLVDSTQEDLTRQLKEAHRIASTIDDQQAVVDLTAALAASASRTMAGLQLSLADSPDSSQSAARESYEVASEAYATRVEALAARVRRPAALALGTLQLRAVDPSSLGLEKLALEVSAVEAHRAGDGDDGWVIISSTSQIVDLLSIAEVERFLAEQSVEPGTYTKVRFSITNATAVKDGQEYAVVVPSGQISLTRPFSVVEGQTTVVLLDFNSAQSLKTTGQGEYTLSPQVRLLAEEPREREQSIDKGKKKPADRGEEAAQRGKGLVPETRKPPRNVEIEGIVEVLSEETLVVQGQRINISPNVKTEGHLESGQHVKVEAVPQADGAFLAVEVKARPKEEKAKDESKRPPSRLSTPTPTPTSSTSTTRKHTQLEGTVQSAQGTEWRVSGLPVVVTDETQIVGIPTEGARVVVEGVEGEGGLIRATVVTVLPSLGGPEATPEATTAPRPQPTLGLTPAPVHLAGEVEQVQEGGMRVSGREVIVTADTKMEGTPATGVRVVVEGVEGEGGVIQATAVKVLLAPGVPEAPPVASPVPVLPPPGGPTVTPTPESPPGAAQASVVLSGQVEVVQKGRWLVAGQEVVVTADTTVQGAPLAGSTVRVEGVQRADGAIQAARIVNEDSP
ncbi:MAG: DUF4382 domain-containing protein [Chloroflexi bacterium]|nr:DUF4382 domain-containing protein [Chloroflexota bacterium]